MIGSFEYNNISSDNFNLICKSVNRPLLPAQRPKMVEIQGKSGVFDFGGGDYLTRQIVMHIAYKGNDYAELRQRARDIAAWLSVGRWSRLIINDESDKFYLARIIESIDLETLNRIGEADIVFECQPFAYQVVDSGDLDDTWDGADYPWLINVPWIVTYNFTATGAKSFTFDNPGTVAIGKDNPQGSKSQIKVVGSWSTLALSLNGKTLTYTTAGSGTLIIDNVYLEVSLNGSNKLSVMSGDLDSFLPITVGDNTIQVSGTGLNVNVTIDFTPAWL